MIKKDKKQTNKGSSLSGTPSNRGQKEEKTSNLKIGMILLLLTIIGSLVYTFLTSNKTQGNSSTGVPNPQEGEYEWDSNLGQRETYHPDYRRYTQRVQKEKSEIFNDSAINEKIVRTLHKFIYQKLHPVIHYDTGIRFNEAHLGLKNDPDYCLKSDILKLEHPETIFDNYYVLIDFDHHELVREINKDFAIDVMPHISEGMARNKKAQRKYDIKPEVALLNSRISRFHHFHQFGKNFICVFQTSNHVPGQWSITGKDLVINNYRTYEQMPFQNQEKCWETVTFMPPSYRLFDEQECLSFFEYLKSPEYQRIVEQNGIGFIMKEGRDIHRGEGITLITKPEQDNLVRKYSGGKKCGELNQVYQVQRYIANPMLYKGHKIEVRIYFFIASTNPLIIYSQNLAHLRMCAEQFDKFSLDKERHVCNVAVSKQTSRDKKNYVVDFPLQGLRDYLMEEGKITDPDWLEKTVYPQIYKAITHLTRSGEHDFLKDSRVNENFAVDFLLDDENQIWFLENNPNPQILQMSEARVKRHYQMFGDMYEIQFKYLRSRTKRVMEFAEKLQAEIKAGNQNLDQFQKEFQGANANRLEEEYTIRADNTYVQIYDGNLQGADQFMGYLPDDCSYV